MRVWLLVIGGVVALFDGLIDLASAKMETETFGGEPVRIVAFSGTHWDPGVLLYLVMGLGLVALAVFLFVLARRLERRPETFRG